MVPTALASYLADSFDRGLCHRYKIDPLSHMRRGSVQAVKNGRAGDTRHLHLGSEHVTVNGQRIFAWLEQVRHSRLAHLGRVGQTALALFENVIFFHGSTQRELASQSCYALDLAPQGHLCIEQFIAGFAVRLSLPWKTNRML